MSIPHLITRAPAMTFSANECYLLPEHAHAKCPVADTTRPDPPGLNGQGDSPSGFGCCLVINKYVYCALLIRYVAQQKITMVSHFMHEHLIY